MFYFKRILLALAALVILFIFTVIFLFLFRKSHIFSETKGRLTLNNKPIENLEVSQTVKVTWSGKTYTKKTKTNKNGEFNFPRLSTILVLGNLLPHEPVISQKIILTYNSGDYVLWWHGKRNYDDGGEIDSKLIELNCDLAGNLEETVQKYSSYRAVSSVCNLNFSYEEKSSK